MNMNMKKLTIATIAMLGLGVSAAQAADGTINFSGSVATAACSIDAGSSSLTVNYDGIPLSKIQHTSAGETSTDLQKPFSIRLTDCPDVISTAKIMIEGLTSTYNENIFIPTGEGAVKYMGIIIQDAETGGAITPKTFEGVNNSKAIVAGNNTLNYLVGLSRTTSTQSPTTGTFTIPLTYTMSYQ